MSWNNGALVGIVVLLAGLVGCADSTSESVLPLQPEGMHGTHLVGGDLLADEDGDGVLGTIRIPKSSSSLEPSAPSLRWTYGIESASSRSSWTIDFEDPPLGFESDRIIDPLFYVHRRVGFTAVPDDNPWGSAAGFGVMGIVKNSATSACADPSDADQKLATGTPRSGHVGRSGFTIMVEFEDSLPAGSVVSFELQALALGAGMMWMYDEDRFPTGAGMQSLQPGLGTCGYPGSPRGRRIVSAESTGRVKYVMIDARYFTASNLVFVIDDFTVQRGIDFVLDVRPGSCENPLNPRSRGVLPVTIVGNGIDSVDLIDPASIRLEGVEASHVRYGDWRTDTRNACTGDGPDGVLDLELKFETERVVAALDPGPEDAEVRVHLTGRLQTGEPFELSGMVRLVGTNGKSANRQAEHSGR